MLPPQLLLKIATPHTISMMIEEEDRMTTTILQVPIKTAVTMTIIDLIDIMMMIAIMTEEEEDRTHPQDEDKVDLLFEVRKRKEPLPLVFMLEIYRMSLVKKMYLIWWRDMGS
jgi:hypothetical protein